MIVVVNAGTTTGSPDKITANTGRTTSSVADVIPSGRTMTQTAGTVTTSKGATDMDEAHADLFRLLPDGVNGWKTAAGDKTYKGEDLYRYIDGGAELYMSYGFERAVSRTYTRTGEPDIVVDLFDMASSKNAFGVFSHSRETIDTTFGQGSQYTEGLLLFWRNRYFISILASPETPDSKRVLFELARRIAGAIGADGPLPAILSLLPKRSLVEESVRYFHHHVWLNMHYFVADENILHIDGNVDALLAKYEEADNRCILLLVEYPSSGKAQTAYADFLKYYLPEFSGDSLVRIEDDTWTGCVRDEDLLIIVFNARGKDTAADLIAAVRKNRSR
jgi:hypothetical protein